MVVQRRIGSGRYLFFRLRQLFALFFFVFIRISKCLFSLASNYIFSFILPRALQRFKHRKFKWVSPLRLLQKIDFISKKISLNCKKPHLLLALCLLGIFPVTHAQMITGVWKGKINRQKVEVKIIQQGDSLTGTSYYYESANRYRRYAIKGYFDAQTNEAVWWDDYLVDESSGGQLGKIPMVSRADFNCPGGARMMLDGKSTPHDTNDKPGDVHLNKTDIPVFPDEWDFVIENYTVGASDQEIIDSISSLSRREPIIVTAEPDPPAIARPQANPIPTVARPPVVTLLPPAPQTIEEKYTSRKKVLVTEIPVTGDSIELRFYDNAEIDGDSISLFLDNKLIFQHIRLLGSAYTIRLAVAELNPTSELTMVAENLGSIPPNTSYMVALVGTNRYEARLESTEGSSAVIKFVKSQ